MVDARLVSPEALEAVLDIQQRDGRKLGTLLVEHGLINEVQLTQILSHQLAVPWVSLLHIEFSADLLSLIPGEVAERYCLVPIYVRNVRNQGETLYVAMDDPTNEDGLDACGTYSGLPVKAMIAPPTDIRNAIRVYYGSRTRASLPTQPQVDPDSASPSFSTEEVNSFEAAALHAMAQSDEAEHEAHTRPTLVSDAFDHDMRPTVELPPSSEVVAASRPDDDFDDADETEVISMASEPSTEPNPPTFHPTHTASKWQASEELLRALDDDEGPPAHAADLTPDIEPERPREPRPAARRVMSLTLLDGTEIRLPAKDPKAKETIPPPPDDQLSAYDLIAALRAAAHGEDAADILGNEVRWEAMFAALLSLLLKKHLITDWEFLEELEKDLGSRKS